MTNCSVHPAHTEKKLAIEEFEKYIDQLKTRSQAKEDDWEGLGATRHRVEILDDDATLYIDGNGTQLALPLDLKKQGPPNSPHKT